MTRERGVIFGWTGTGIIPHNGGMGMTLQEIEAAALELPRVERMRLAQTLTESVELSNNPAADEAWVEVAVRRLREINEGRDVLVDGDEAMRRVYAALNAKI
jgi:hypothetical protein